MASSMSMSLDEARERLKKLRDDQSRNSEEVIEIWEEVITEYTYKLGDELWLIYEQVCVASLDCARLDIAEVCIESLKAQFPTSLRVKRLEGLKEEARERYDLALEIYEDILEEDETNSLVRKRKVAIFKAQNKIPEAIKELSKYLDLYPVDYEAWLELCDLYVLEQDYAKAAFCMEEVLMSNPHNHLYHLKYAEIKYTQGGIENLEQARSYFSQAIKISPNNMRALFGLFMAASSVASYPKSNSKTKAENGRYANWAAKQIAEKYQELKSDKEAGRVRAIESMLDSLQISPSSS